MRHRLHRIRRAGCSWLIFTAFSFLVTPQMAAQAAGAAVESSPWFATMVSQRLDYLGQGLVQQFDERSAHLTVETDTTGHLLVHWQTATMDWYSFDVSVPAGLGVGYFRSHPDASASTGAVNITAAGYGCNTPASTFDIRRLGRNADGQLSQLDLVYEIHCDALEPAMTGELRLGIPATTHLLTQPSAVRWPDVFPTAPASRASVVVRAIAATSATVTSALITGPQASSYRIEHDYCTGSALSATNRCLIYLTFRPVRAGPNVASLSVGTTDGRLSVPLDGMGISGVTALQMTSDAGDWIGSGTTNQPATYSYTPANSTYQFRFAAWEEPPPDGLRMRLFDFGGVDWMAQFVAATGQHLVPGTYTDADPNRRSRPGLEISGDSRGCQNVTGTFNVAQIQYDPFTLMPSRYDISFVQHCDGVPDALQGRIRYRAAADVTAPGRPASATVTFSHGMARLQWTNSAASDFAGVVVRQLPGAKPPDLATFGLPAYSGTATYANLVSTSGSHSFALFSYDRDGNVSSPRHPAVVAAQASSFGIGRSAETIYAGTTARITGKLLDVATGVGVSHAPATLSCRRTGTATWHTCAALTTTSTGAVTATVTPTAATDYRWVFVGLGPHDPATSPSTRIYVRP